MVWFSLLLVFSVVCAENYAILYGTIEHLTNTELPSSSCRFYDYLISIGFKRDNIVYMLDTTDYHTDYSEFYTSWYSEENLLLRDTLYKLSCPNMDFEGTYVSPKFLLHYLIGDEKNIKSMSGMKDVKMIHPSKEDNILVYFSDSHGCGSQFYPDRVLSPDLVKKSVLIMKKHKMFKSLFWLVEASYGDYSFHKLEKMHNVIALTIKEPKESGIFTFISTDDDTKEKEYIESLWDTNWPSILPLACNHSIRYLYQLALSALLQMPDKLQMPGIWGDKEMLNMSLSEFLTSSGECREFYIYKSGSVSDDEIKSLLSDSFVKNFNVTIPMQHTRRAFQSYSRFMESIIREVFMAEIDESNDFPVNLDGCQSFLQYSLQHECAYFMPIADPLLSLFHTLCGNRKGDGMIMIDFKPYCAKNVPADNMW